jgi:hypothetical protein
MVRRVDLVTLVTNRTFLSQFFQVNVVTNSHVVGSSLKHFVVTAKVRTLETKSLLKLVGLLCFLSILEKERSRIGAGLCNSLVGTLLICLSLIRLLSILKLPRTRSIGQRMRIVFIFGQCHFEETHV